MRLYLLFISIFCFSNLLLAQQDSVLISNEELSQLSLTELQQKAEQAFENFEIQAAIIYGQTAVDTAKQQVGQQDSLYSNALTILGRALQLKGDYGRAEALFKEALAVNQKIEPNKKWRVSRSYARLGGLYASLQRMQEALDYFEKSRALMIDIVSPSSIEMCELYMNIGGINRKLGRLEEAEIIFEQVLSIFTENKVKNQDNLISIYSSLGGLYKDYKKYDQSEPMYAKAVAIIKKKYGTEHPEYARSMNNMGILYKRMGQYEKAEKMYLEALRIRKNVLGPDHYRVGTCLGNLGKLYAQIKLYNKAIIFHQEALKINLNAVGPKTLRVSASYLALAEDYLNVFKLKEAEAFIFKAFDSNCLDSVSATYAPMQIAKESRFLNLSYANSIFSVWIKIKEAQYHKDKRIDDLKKAHEVIVAKSFFIKKAETELSATKDKMRMLAHAPALVRKSFKMANRIYIETRDKYYLEMMLRFAEDNKSALLSSTLHAEEALLFGSVPDSLIEKEHAIKEKLSKLYSDLAEAQNESDAASVSTAREALIKANLEKGKIQKKLETEYPRYNELRHRISEVDVQEIQETLLDGKTALLEFFVTEEFAYLMLVFEDDISCYPISFGKGELKRAVKKLRKGLSDYIYIVTEPKESTRTYKEAAQYFYQKLIAPAARELKHIEHLIIVPDGELGHIPFEVLLTRVEEQGGKDDFASLPYLIKDFKISYSYSAQLSLESHSKIPKTKNGQILALAAEYSKDLFSDASNRSPNQKEVRGQLIALKGVKKETETLSELFKKGAFYYGKEANEKQFKAVAEDYTIIHLAMHGILNKEQPMLSSLAFTENGDSTEDNFLEAYEISNMNLDNQLIVLSACETGYGKFEQGEGVLSLARSFMYAGVPSLVVSLWQVNDGSTATIMKLFYQGLLEGKAKDTALQEAKLKYIQFAAKKAKGLGAHPAFWSPFIQLGDSRPIELVPRTNYWWWALGVLFLGGALFGLKKLRRA